MARAKSSTQSSASTSIATLLGFSLLILVVTLAKDLSVYIPSINHILVPIYGLTSLSEETMQNSQDDNLNNHYEVAVEMSTNKGWNENNKTLRVVAQNRIDLTPDVLEIDPWINKTIREWGCSRAETPAIFVHIGKAGGGMIRARFAAAAHNYDRKDWHAPHKDDHFYPVSSTTEGKFCNSNYRTWRLPNTTIWKESFEGNMPCNARTPIGMAMACPEAVERKRRCLACQDWTSAGCHTIYMGHNLLGSELHWLPPSYLQKWWDSTPWSFKVDWSRLEPSSDIWCIDGGAEHNARPLEESIFRQVYEYCSKPTSDLWDEQFQSFWLQQQGNKSSTSADWINFSPVYASLPVQRITLIREPWSWLLSKFFWHRDESDTSTCDDLSQVQEWAHKYAIHFIAYLCGDDCAIRYERGLMSLAELWIQSESNLRQAFSVVGLMNETMAFYDMVSTRIAYLDMSRNAYVQGNRHSSLRTRETVRCRRVFSSADFREAMEERVPALRILNRLYQVAVEVNRFQLEELQQCQN